ncbi:MAG: hypothetical protein O3B01_02580 [Planctomycetota bacterium]|nr:hypothetical protein [Planctomycetota bacterium]MDA1137445.1 hypothetical protein [Planctomycetota bacterium]
MATRTRRTAVRKKKLNLGPIVFTIVAMGFGGGGSYFFITKHKENKAQILRENEEIKRKNEEQRAILQKREEDRTARLEAARAEREQKKKELEEAKAGSARRKQEMVAVDGVKAALPDLMADAQYERALAMLADARKNDLTEETKAAIDNLKQQVAEKARDEFMGIKDQAQGLADAGDVAGAVKMLEGAGRFGLSDISQEASQLIKKLNSNAESEEPDSISPQIAAFKMIQSELASPLRDSDYDRAEVLVDRLAGQVSNKPFKETLESMKGDFALVTGLWAEFLKTMAASPGKEVQFGIVAGKVVKAEEGLLVVDNKGNQESLTLKDMQPKWIEMHLDLQPGADDEKWYAVALFNLHKGRDTTARPIFSRISDVYPKAKGKLEWMDWEEEVKVKDLVEEVKESAQSGSHSTVINKVAEIKKSYANTRYYKEQEAKLASLEEKSAAEREQAKGKVGDRLEVLENAYAKAKEDLDAWFENTKTEIEDRKEQALTDPVAYRKYTSSSSIYYSSSSTSVGGRTYYGGYGYYIYSSPTSKETNLQAIDDILNMKQSYRTPYTETQKKKLEQESKRLTKEIQIAKIEFATNASKLKILIRKKQDHLKNISIRIGRQLRNGEELSDDDIANAFK